MAAHADVELAAERPALPAVTLEKKVRAGHYRRRCWPSFIYRTLYSVLYFHPTKSRLPSPSSLRSDFLFGCTNGSKKALRPAELVFRDDIESQWLVPILSHQYCRRRNSRLQRVVFVFSLH